MQEIDDKSKQCRLVVDFTADETLQRVKACSAVDAERGQSSLVDRQSLVNAVVKDNFITPR